VNVDRLVCGVATCFGVRAYDGRIWHRERGVAQLEASAVPLRLDHGAILDSRGGLMSIGVAWRFVR
jgi:hypothetical protein